MNTTIHPSLKRLFEKTNLKASELAEALNVSPQSITNWAKRGVSKQGAIQASKVFGIESSYILKGGEEEHLQSNIDSFGSFQVWSSNSPLSKEDHYFLPFFKDIEFHGGNGRVVHENATGFVLPFAKSTLYRNNIPHDQAFCVTITGNSMEPVIPEGATVGINKADKNIRDGEIYAIKQGDLFRIKRLYRMPSNKIRINSYNESEYKDEVTDADTVEIVGRVFTWQVMRR